MSRRRDRPGLLRALARAAGAVALGFAVRDRAPGPDEQARALVHARRSETLDRTMPVLTDLGSTYAVAGAAATLWLTGRRSLARDVAAAGMLAWAVTQGMKPFFRRPRPYDVGEVEMLVRKPAGLSYPSGHPAVAAAVAGVIGARVHPPARGLVERIPRVVGFSRLYVGVHYPSDVIGGLLIGRAVGDLWRRYARA